MTAVLINCFKDEWTANMEPVFDFPLKLTAEFQGKWRLSMYLKFMVNGKELLHCNRFFGDVIEV
jgi:hypothetical protein